jgi:AcrR family transcriptional regulator
MSSSRLDTVKQICQKTIVTTDLKERVLSASLELIREAGLSGLSLREVARRADVSHQAPYHHFQDKESIVAALVERSFLALAERLEAVASGKGTAAQRLSRTGRAYVDFALGSPVEFRLMFRPELVDASRFPSVQSAGARAYAVLTRLVGEQAQLSPEKRDALVSLHWSLVHGLATLLLDGALGQELSGPKARDRHVDRVLSLFSQARGLF